MVDQWIKNQEGWLHGYVRPKATAVKNEIAIKEKDATYGVTFYPLKCPRCASKKVKCYHTESPVRYHKCKECQFKFKSREAEE
jgi:transposase-like protein